MDRQMKLRELLIIIQGTQIQKEALVKNYIGSNIEIHTDIRTIDNSRIGVSWDNFGIEEGGISTGASFNIQYEKAKFGNQLLSYSCHDRVMIIAKLDQADFSSGSSGYYQFELVSIRKLSTHVERSKANQAKGEALREVASRAAKAAARTESAKQRAGFAAGVYFGYLLPIFSWITALIVLAISDPNRFRIGDVLMLAFIPVVNWIFYLSLVLFNSNERPLALTTLIVWAAVGGFAYLAASIRT
jgi:hypothetical protein